MNKIFKIVWNAARGKMMVVNEATSSVQTGKKTAVTVAVVGALAAGSAMADVTVSGEGLGKYSAIDGYNTSVEIDEKLVVNVEDASHDRLYGINVGQGASTPSDNKPKVTITADAEFNLNNDKEVRVFRVFGGDLEMTGDINVTAVADSGFINAIDIRHGGNATFEGSEFNVAVEGTPGASTVMNGVDISTTVAEKRSVLNLNSDKTVISVTNKSTDADVTTGIYSAYADVNVTGGAVLNVTSNGGEARGVSALSDPNYPASVVTFAGDQTALNVTGSIALGMFSSGENSSIVFEGDSVQLNVTANEDYARGIRAQYGAEVNSATNTTLDIDVNAKGSAYGIQATDSGGYSPAGTVNLEGNVDVFAKSTDSDAYGIYKLAETGGGDVTIGGVAQITATAEKGTAYGVFAQGFGSVEANGDVTITASGTNATGARVVSSDVTLGGEEKVVTVKSTATTGNAYGIQLRNDYKNPSQVIVEGSELNVSATTGESGSAMGLVVQGMSTNGKEPLSTLVVKSDTATITASDIGVWASGDAYAAFNGASRIEIAAPVAIEARDYAKVMVNEKGTADVAIKGDVDFSMQYGGKNSALVDFNLNTPDSSWDGNVKLAWIKKSATSVEQFKQATLKINLANGAQWTPTKVEDAGTIGSTEEGVLATAVRTMTMDGGVVNVNAGIKAQLDTLSGSGTVNLAADVAKADDAGYFIAANAADTTLDVNLTGVTADDNVNVEALMGHIQAEGATVKGYVQEGQVQGAIVVDADGEVVEQAVNSKTEALADKVWLAPNMITRIMMNDVRKRMGDLRAAEGTHGVWARYNGGQMSGSGVDADFNMIQVGIDTVPVVDATRFGVAFSYAQTESEDNLGTTDMDSFSLAFYGTKMYDNGMFVDVIGRMATMDSDIVNAGAKGKMDNVALSLSGELGWRFDVTDRFFFEPSVEATYTYTNADTFTMTNGGTYELEAMDSLVGRAGFAAGFKCPANKGDVYVRAAVVHEFMGDSTINSWTANGAATPIESDGKDTWFEYAIGAQFNVNKNTYVYADIERTEGATMDEDWRANVGVRFAF